MTNTIKISHFKRLGELSMGGTYKVRAFVHDERAVSEEFTTLPALSVVMIGFTLFIVLLAQTYTAYEERIDRLQRYHTADTLALKLTNPDCYFIKEGGLIDIQILQDDTQSLERIRNEYQKSGITFILRLRWTNTSEDFPEELPSITGNRVAVSKDVGIYLNEAQTVPGTLTIILWSVPP